MAATLTLYAALLAYMVPRHEPWADEAQAWELAKSLSLPKLFGTYVHYEFSPGLWHACLWLLARLHVTYAGLHWATALIALAGVALLMSRAPFPFLCRLLLPFTYFLAYQYAVIARSYVLMAPLLFALAWVWPQRGKRPLPTALLLGLLANVCVHGFVIGTGLVFVLLMEWRTAKWQLSGEEQNLRNTFLARTSAERLLAAGAIAVLLSFALWCLVPRPDTTWFLAMKSIGSHAPGAASAQVFIPGRRFRWIPLPFLYLLGLVRRLSLLLSVAFCNHRKIGDAAWLLLAWRCYRAGKLRYLLPLLLLTVVVFAARVSFYHSGMTWLLFLFLWWVTWPGQSAQRAGWIEVTLLGLVLWCIGGQLLWTARAIHFDATQTYSPDRDGARLLQAYLRQGDRVDLAILATGARPNHSEFFATGLEPYFDREPLGNMRARFWIWKSDDDMRFTYLHDTEARRVVVLMEQTDEDDRWTAEVERLQLLGYRPAARVCGQSFYPYVSADLLCHVFYEPPR